MFEQTPLGARLALCVDALALRERMRKAQPAKQIQARTLTAKRLSAIRRKLLGLSAARLSDDLLNPARAVGVLRDALASAKNATSDAKIETGMYVKGIIDLLRSLENAEVSVGVAEIAQTNADLAVEASELVRVGSQESGGSVDAIVNANILRGKFDAEAISKAAASPLVSELRIENIDAQLSQKLIAAQADIDSRWVNAQEIAKESSRIWERITEARKSRASEDEINRLADEYEANKANYNAAYALYSEGFDKLLQPVRREVADALQAAKDKANEPKVALGRSAIDSVLQASTVTDDEARVWAEAQEITKPAVARLKKIGYPLEQVRADMAEFYRLTGGRVTAVRLHSKGNKRANATNIEAHGQLGTINMDGDFDKKTLWHEMGHHIEADPVAKLAAGRMIRRRAEDGGAVSKLRSLTGNSGYASDEVAFKDGFFSPYVGKVYRSGTTEVFSMGIESFSSPSTLGMRMAEDPETLEFVAGFLKAEQSPLSIAFRDIRDAMREINETSREETEEANDTALEGMYRRLSSGIEFKPASEYPAPEGRDIWGLEYLGGFPNEPEMYLFAGKIRNHETGRRVNGYSVVRFRFDQHSGYLSYDNCDIPAKDMQLAKVAVAVAIKMNAPNMPRYWNLTNPEFLKGYV